VRAIAVFFYLLLLIRLGKQRLFGKQTSFDVVLSIILGSILSRTVTGNARLLPTMAASAVLVGLHRLLATLAWRSHRFGALVKGREIRLVEDGRILWDAMRRQGITEHDLFEAVRARAQTDDLSRVKGAYLERSGQISVIVEK
jgi:uncharacterized membrane protein YcaP (DUF421 family)